jgi:hypothetical protein
MDEISSYLLANNDCSDGWFKFEDGVTYDSVEKLFEENLSVSDDDRFNYSQVWSNQAGDVHPPLYYMILHTICSLFPNHYSIWYAGSINIIFALLSLYFFRKIIKNLVNDDIFVEICSWAFTISAGILSTATFMRMYIMAMFWVTLICYLFLKALDMEKITWKFWVALLFTSIAAALTHYYCIVYLAFICCVFGVYLLIRKRWRDVVLFVATMAVAGGMSILIFPSIIRHMFLQGRGTEAISNLMNDSLSYYISRLKTFYSFVDGYMLGNALAIVTMIAVFVFILRILGLITVDDKYTDNIKWVMMIVPPFLYFLLISKIAAYATDKYISPIYIVVLATVLCSIYYFVKDIVSSSKMYIIVCGVFAIITINSWKSENWIYLFQSAETYHNDVQCYSGLDCIYIYSRIDCAYADYKELSIYKSVTFVPEDRIDMITSLEVASSDQIMVRINGDEDTLLSQVIEMCPSLNYYTKIGSIQYGSTYYVYN